MSYTYCCMVLYIVRQDIYIKEQKINEHFYCLILPYLLILSGESEKRTRFRLTLFL
jgi:hypothetical protein